LRVSYLGIALLLLGLVVIGTAYAGYPLSVVSTPSLHYSMDANVSTISSITKAPDGYTFTLSTLYNNNSESNPWVFGLSYYNAVTPSVPITIQYQGRMSGMTYSPVGITDGKLWYIGTGSGISKWAHSASGTINETVYVTNVSSGQTTQHTIPVSVSVSVLSSTGAAFYGNGYSFTYYAVLTASGTYRFYDPSPPNENSAEYSFSFGTSYGTISYGNTSYSITLIGSKHYSNTSTSSTLTFGNTKPIYGEFGSSPSPSPIYTTNFTYGNFWVGTSLNSMEKVTPSQQALNVYTSAFPTTLYVIFVFNGSIPSNYINVFYTYQIYYNNTTPASSGIVNFYNQPTTSIIINGKTYPYAFVSTLNISDPSDIVLNGEYATGEYSSIPIMEIGGFSDNAPVQPAFSTQQYISFGIGAVLILIGVVWIFKR